MRQFRIPIDLKEVMDDIKEDIEWTKERIMIKAIEEFDAFLLSENVVKYNFTLNDTEEKVKKTKAAYKFDIETEYSNHELINIASWFIDRKYQSKKVIPTDTSTVEFMNNLSDADITLQSGYNLGVEAVIAAVKKEHPDLFGESLNPENFNLYR